MFKNRYRLLMANDAGGGGGGGAAAGAGAGDVGAAAGAGAGPGGEWFTGIKDEAVRGWVQSKGFKDPEAAAQSAWHLEKLLGADKAGRSILLPKDEKDEAGYRAVLAKLGMPEKPDGYGFNPEGVDAELLSRTSAHFHKLGLTKAQAAGLMEFIGAENKALEEAEAKADETFTTQSAKEFDELKGKWGADSDRNIELARRAARQFLPKEQAGELMDKMERAIGTRAMLEFFHAVGAGLGESSVDGGGSGGGNGFGGMSVEGARARLSELRKDPEYVKAWANGDAAKRKEIADLDKIIAGG